jgi:HAD superfamily hydrolase (TIGR01509 family)
LNTDFGAAKSVKMACIIFDMDGTLVDSEPACCQALLDLLPDLTDDLTSLIDLYRGKKLANILTDVENKIGRKLPTAFDESYRDRVAAIFDSGLQAMPGAAETLAAIRVPICVASSAPKQKIQHALKVTGLSRFFGDRIFSSYDVGFWKPDPRLFLLAAKKMGATPDRCAVIEDSAVGIAAAVSAGMRAIQYLPYEGRDVADGALAIRDLREITDVRFAEWIR